MDSVSNAPGDVTVDMSGYAVAEALTDHHLDEVAAMIERAQAEERSSERSFDETAAEHARGT